MTIRETITRSMQPIWSTSSAQARSRVIKLYKAWYRQIPTIVEDYNLPYTTSECRAKLHAEFMKQKHLSDIRQIDSIVINRQLELKDVSCIEKSRSHVLNYWNGESFKSNQRTQFLSKFLVGQN